ncbi:alpha/beta hydrolase [Mycobacterium sp. ACS1612]|uniref:alpha/beta fold hydrolase n=1 Tax=Mycobacterium sp. ACS1612 TaxID=1834117 RepID=UPI0007FF4D8E|nr:alpha/beta fold hydrolase [Mycobacterium sp. ACS1612]OBF36286.1 alpha/beta hydrolase [Mycobacterium sp. ACS1612]
MAHSRFTSNDGTRIHYLDSGGPDHGAPIVFVPGMTDVADDYVEVLPLLGRRTVVVELRGHGKSDAPETGYDLAALRDDVGAVVDAVTDGPVHVMTFSRGTTYAIAWALANPDRVRSLAIGDYVPAEIVLPDAHIHRLLDGRWRGTPVSDRLDYDAAVKTFHAAQNRSFWEPLSVLRVPMLVVRSPDFPLVDGAAWHRYQQLFPWAELHEFTDSPHDIFRPDRGRYPKLVRELINR